MPLSNGDAVRQKVVVIEGVVVDVQYDAETGAFKYLVDYADGEGTTSRRWFEENEVEVVNA